LLYRRNFEQTKIVFTNKLSSELIKRYSKDLLTLVISEKIAKLYPFLIKEFKECSIDVIPFPDGEKVKTLNYFNKLCETLLERKIQKETILCAVGGGTLLDLCGFVSSILFRGIKWVAVPTTLLSMVDASIGGKTAINSKKGKNLFGSFHFPLEVFIDMNFLNTLPESHLRDGLVECVKCGIIRDKKLFEMCLNANLNDCDSLKLIVKKAQEIKFKIVSKDPYEQKGERYLLNFGHTVGHSLEQYFNYRISHGRCVAKGIVLESALSYIQGYLKKEDFLNLKESIEKISSQTPPIRNLKLVWQNMAFDKKNKEKKVMYVPIKAIGKPALTSPFLAQINFKTLNKAFFMVKSHLSKINFDRTI